MAKKVIIVDDIDGTEGDGIVTHRFSLGSDFYEIDLCPQNLLSLRTALEPFVSAGRRVRGGNRRTPEPAPRQQGNSALDFPRQQPLAAAPHQQGNSALDFQRAAAAGGCTAPAGQLGVGLPTRAAAGDSELGS